MSDVLSTPEERFAALVEEFISDYAVTLPLDGSSSNNRFGSSGLRVHNKIFAMLSGGRLVVKLPKARVDALVASGDGERFDPRRDGRLMKEWLSLAPTSEQAWLPLAKEAKEFVAGAG
jgi:TfoX/Sxy family transcriptional regulator of competence genes